MKFLLQFQIAASFFSFQRQINLTTIRMWITVYVEVAVALDISATSRDGLVDCEMLFVRWRGSEKRRKNQEIIACLVECVEQHPTYTLRQLKSDRVVCDSVSLRFLWVYFRFLKIACV